MILLSDTSCLSTINEQNLTSDAKTYMYGISGTYSQEFIHIVLRIMNS